MVKLSYSGRKIQGLRLGQVVAKDLRKRIPPGSGARAAARDPNVELDLTGKLVGNDGLAEIINALVACIKFRDEAHPQGVIRLTELSLKRNALTVAAMTELAEVVALSNSSLARLDISENEISVVDNGQRNKWRTFLKSFEGCYMLKCIDFSGNQLGSAGFDVFAGIYLKSDLDFVVSAPPEKQNEYGCERDIDSQFKSISLSKSDDDNGHSVAVREVNKRGVVRPKNTESYASTRGLRSVPYLIFTKSGNTSACAFHLWSASMIHLEPEELLEFLPPGKSMVSFEVAQSGWGIVFSPTEFGPLGRNLFSLGAKFSQEFSKVSDDLDTLSAGDDLDPHEVIKTRQNCQYIQRLMERAKYRIILDILMTEGLRAVELWTVAFRTMVVARAILLDDKDKPQAVIESNEFEQS
ncbi:predicted protein [Uncinocarpus reesii 1704]|uniref:Leucine rich repeat protein n=1 Tax=Uncinocarpus reesii (strain UAMH 1704) TaxID=336963 RepID=C4JSF7_UNCRE|nr:uncharacterized protein UREG_05396 [Uncinocarpus reesii 1704]EEP80554.1 predicted protein [Uncinocarpus reesii 1704]